MPHFGFSALARGLRIPACACALVLLFGVSGCSGSGASSSALPANDSDPRAAQAFIRPAELAAVLKGSGEKPLLLHVGFRALYRGGAIPGSKYVGAGSTPEGLAGLQSAVAGVPPGRAIVLYCGCCPWDHCPNMRPAFDTLRRLGYTNVRALYVPHDLERDWANAGYPLEKPAD